MSATRGDSIGFAMLFSLSGPLIVPAHRERNLPVTREAQTTMVPLEVEGPFELHQLWSKTEFTKHDPGVYIIS